MELNLRQASESDRNEVLQLLRDAFAPYMAKLGRIVEPDSFAGVRQALADGQVSAAVGSDGIEGVLIEEPLGATLYVKVVAVRPDQQGKGLGSRMLEEIETRARDRGFEALTLDTAEVMEDLLRLYGRHGFREIRRAPPDHGRDETLRVFMRKDLL